MTEILIILDLNIHNEIRTDTFTLCGFWEGVPVMMAQETAVSNAYADLETTPYYETDGTDFSGYMNISFNFSNSFNIEGQMEDLIQRCGFDGSLISPSVNWAYSFSSIDWVSVSILAILIFLGSALFTVLTVYISCIRPCRIAAKVSPVEAVRFTKKSVRKKIA